MAAVIEQERGIVDSFARHSVNLVDQNPAFGPETHCDRRSLAALHLKLDGCTVQQEGRRRFQLQQGIVSGIQIRIDPAVFPGGHGFHQPAVLPPDLEAGIGDADRLVVLSHGDQLQAAYRFVVYRDGLRVVLPDLYGKRFTVQNVTFGGFRLPDDQGAGIHA